MSEHGEPSKVDTEGSEQILNRVKGRLERMDTGDLPVIEHIGPDGSVRRVDHTGEMVRPDPGQIDAAREAAEAFAREHRTAAVDARSAGPSAPSAPPEGSRTIADTAPVQRKGLWARIAAWFRRG